MTSRVTTSGWEVSGPWNPLPSSRSHLSPSDGEKSPMALATPRTEFRKPSGQTRPPAASMRALSEAHEGLWSTVSWRKVEVEEEGCGGLRRGGEGEEVLLLLLRQGQRQK